MLVHAKSKKLVLNLRNTARVTEVIPTAKTLEYKGKTLVAVPHKLDEVRVLRNIGIDAPGPIRHYYDWPGLFKPFEHQYDTADFLTMHPRSFCLNDMGTGKTISVLWAYDFLRRWDYIDGSLLIISPLSTLERTWADEVFKNFAHLNVSVLHGTSDRRMKLLKAGADVFVINHDGIKNKALLAELVAMVKDGRISVVTVDELASFRNSGTDRWKALRQIVKESPYVWGLTGTPIPNEPTDAWAQIRLIAPERVPAYFKAFKEATMKQIGPYKWVKREGALDHVYSVMQPAIRYSREQCIDLPPTTYQTREVELTAEQAKAYKEMMAKLKAEYEGGQITALNEAVKRTKLLQICCGVAYSGDQEVVIPAQPRLDELVDIVEQSASKVIVFVPFRASLENVAGALRKHYTVATVHGGTPRAERDETFSAFQRTAEPQVIVAQPGCMSHGLTLTAADTICWYGPAPSAEIYLQANARIVRPGQKRNTLIVHLESSLVERKTYDVLQGRSTTQNVLLDMFQT